MTKKAVKTRAAFTLPVEAVNRLDEVADRLGVTKSVVLTLLINEKWSLLNPTTEQEEPVEEKAPVEKKAPSAPARNADTKEPKIKIGHRYIYPDQLSPKMKEFADKRIFAHRKAWEHPDEGLGTPIAIWWDKNKVFCVEYRLPDGNTHWFHYQHTGNNWQYDGFEWF